MNIIKTFLIYNFSLKAHPRYYSEKGPAPDVIRISIDNAVQKFTKGKKGFVGVRNYTHKCPVCNVEFWSDRDAEKSCGRWKCFMEVYKGL